MTKVPLRKDIDRKKFMPVSSKTFYEKLGPHNPDQGDITFYGSENGGHKRYCEHVTILKNSRKVFGIVYSDSYGILQSRHFISVDFE